MTANSSHAQPAEAGSAPLWKAVAAVLIATAALVVALAFLVGAVTRMPRLQQHWTPNAVTDFFLHRPTRN